MYASRFRVDQNILVLQVAVDDTTRVHRHDHLDDLAEEVARYILRQRAAVGDVVEQVLGVGRSLHHQHVAAADRRSRRRCRATAWRERRRRRRFHVVVVEKSYHSLDVTDALHVVNFPRNRFPIVILYIYSKYITLRKLYHAAARLVHILLQLSLRVYVNQSISNFFV